jgi:spore germination protein (amino acid permease)
MGTGKIGETEAVTLLVAVIIGKVFLSLPSAMANQGGSAAWQIILLAGLVTLLLFSFIHQFMLLMGDNDDFPTTVERLAGRYLGGIITILIVLLLLVDLGLVVRQFAEMIVLIALPETAISYIVFCLIGAAALVAYLGIQTIARASYLTFPLTLGAIFIIALLTYPSWNSDWLFPLLGKGIDNTLKNGVLFSSEFTEIQLLYLLPFVFYTKQVKRIGYKAIIISTGIFLLVVVTYILTFPPSVATEPYLPLYMMARGVYLGRFLQRIEAVFVIFWVISGYLWIATGLYGFVRLLSDYLKLADYRPLVLPGAVLATAIAFIPANLPDAMMFVVKYYRTYGFLWVFGIPALLLLVARLRGKGAPRAKE